MNFMGAKKIPIVSNNIWGRLFCGSIFSKQKKKRAASSVVDAMEVKEEEPPKRIKTQQHPDEPEDRISLLPDGLIIDEILPRLESTKYAIRTGALSKRWQHLWPSVPSLHFTDYDFKGDSFLDDKPLPDFYMWVDKTLAQCQCKNLNKFSVSADYDFRFKSRVNRWIHFATSSEVQQLHLELRFKEDPDQFVFEDDCFFINSHFTHLHLENCLFNPSGGPISWNNLTHLTISSGRLNHDLIEDILSGSPILDTLTLVDCCGYLWLNITSKSVRNLVFCGYYPEEENLDLDDVIEINAPYISSLKICGTIFLWKISLRDVSSLVKAELNYTKWGYNETTRKVEREEMLKRFVLRLRHVKELKIGRQCYTAFSRLEAKGFIFPSNLKVVKVDYRPYDTDESTEVGGPSDNDSSVGDTAGSVLVTQLKA